MSKLTNRKSSKLAILYFVSLRKRSCYKAWINIGKITLLRWITLRQGIHLRGYAQKNPKQEYKRESFELFSEMLENLKIDVVSILSKVQVRAEEDVEKVEEQHRKSENAPREYQHEEVDHVGGEAPQGAVVSARVEPKVGRNEPCPCGSGQKFKQCCGKLK